MQEGYTADGVELNHWLNIYARLKAMRTGVGKSTTFHTMDLWQVDYSQYDDVVVFGVSEMMDELCVHCTQLLESPPEAHINTLRTGTARSKVNSSRGRG